jgi:hypothetical protein
MNGLLWLFLTVEFSSKYQITNKHTLIDNIGCDIRMAS